MRPPWGSSCTPTCPVSVWTPPVGHTSVVVAYGHTVVSLMSVQWEWPKRWDPDFLEWLRERVQGYLRTAIAKVTSQMPSSVLRGAATIDDVSLGNEPPVVQVIGVKALSLESTVVEVAVRYGGEAGPRVGVGAAAAAVSVAPRLHLSGLEISIDNNRDPYVAQDWGDGTGLPLDDDSSESLRGGGANELWCGIDVTLEGLAFGAILRIEVGHDVAAVDSPGSDADCRAFSAAPRGAPSAGGAAVSDRLPTSAATVASTAPHHGHLAWPVSRAPRRLTGHHGPSLMGIRGAPSRGPPMFAAVGVSASIRAPACSGTITALSTGRTKLVRRRIHVLVTHVEKELTFNLRCNFDHLEFVRSRLEATLKKASAEFMKRLQTEGFAMDYPCAEGAPGGAGLHQGGR